MISIRKIIYEALAPADLAHSPEWRLRVAAAKTGSKDQIGHLVHDEHPSVKHALVFRNLFNDQLMHDSDPSVREKVAIHGDDSHREHLLNDPSTKVRNIIAVVSKNPHHLLTLATDENDFVRAEARKSLHYEGLDK